MKPLYTEVPTNPGAGRTEPGRQLRSYENYTPQEKARYDADKTAQGYLIMSLTNDVLRKLDSYQNSAKENWDQLEKIMQGSKVGNQLRITNIMDRYEKFRMKEGEKLDETYERFVVLMNEMKKNGIHRTEMDNNFKFLNNLQPEWKSFARHMRQHKQLDELKVYEVYETLKQYEEEVQEILEEKNKKDQVTASPIALVAEKKSLKGVVDFEEKDVEYQGESDEDDLKEVMRQMILLTNTFQKKFFKQPSSNSQRYYSRPGRSEVKDRYPVRRYDSERGGNTRRYDDGRVEERYDRMGGGRDSAQFEEAYERKAEKSDQNDNRMIKKPDDKTKKENVTCFKCGKVGHFARDCPTKMSKVEILRKKLLLDEMEEAGQALLAEDEYWCDHSDDEDQVPVTLIAKIESDDEEPIQI